MKAMDPMFVAPRLVPREWGRTDRGEWLGRCSAPRDALTGEAWVLDPAGRTDAGPVGQCIARQAGGMLGDLGRAPPKIRLVFPGETAEVPSTSPVSFWTILDAGIASPREAAGTAHRAGERIRAYEGAAVRLAAGSVALEVSSSFQPTNDADPSPQIIRLPPVSTRTRATLFREPGLSVEVWLLPEWSRIVPDGETCHSLVALTPGIQVDGRTLRPGEAVLVPAWGRPFDIVAANRGAKLLVAYPDRTPTAVWRRTPSPDPAAGQLRKPQPWPQLSAVAQSFQPAMAA